MLDITLGNEMIYSVDLPLVNNKPFVAKQFVSYPTPNVMKTITLHVQVPNEWYINYADKVNVLSQKCQGKSPIVCPPVIINRDSQGGQELCLCSVKPGQGNTHSLCHIKLVCDRTDKLYYFHVNSFVLVTFGTDLVAPSTHLRSTKAQMTKQEKGVDPC